MLFYIMSLATEYVCFKNKINYENKITNHGPIRNFCYDRNCYKSKQSGLPNFVVKSKARKLHKFKTQCSDVPRKAYVKYLYR